LLYYLNIYIVLINLFFFFSNKIQCSK